MSHFFEYRMILSEPLPPQFDALSENQRSCLRLVAKGMTSKEIAQQTGLSPQTVDTYLKQAMQRLNASTRRDAARKLEEHELSQNLGSPTQPIEASENDGDALRTVGAKGWLSRFRLPPVGGRINRLSSVERVMAVLTVAVISAAIIFALTLFLAGLMETFR